MTDFTRAPALTDAERRCPTCTTSFVPHPRKPSQIYCSERCRATAWRRRRALRPVTSPPATKNPPATRNEDGNEVRNEDDTKNGADTRNGDANEVNAVQRCPHCRQPIVLVTLITTPAAAHVAVPDPHPARHITGRRH